MRSLPLWLMVATKIKLTAVEHPRIVLTVAMLLVLLLLSGDPVAALETGTAIDSGGSTTQGATIGDGGP